MLTSVTRSPTKFSTRLMTFVRTASEICGMDLPYSTVIERSIAVSSSPTSTVTPRVVLDPPLTLSRTPPTARDAPPPSPFDSSLKVHGSGVKRSILAELPPGEYVLNVGVLELQGDVSYSFRIMVK